MAGKYNPFRPDKIVPPGMFCGRMDELRFLDHCLLQTKNGNPQHFLVEGERGIGKSSLLLSELVVATGRAQTFDGDKSPSGNMRLI
jgi:Cdc6-like AAA superfamily ATPase